MRILLCYPGHSGSTYNTAFFYASAFKQLGLDVVPFRYHQELLFQNKAIQAFRNTPDKDYEGESILLATRMLMGYVAAVNPDAIISITALAMYKHCWKWLREFKANLKHPYKVVLILTESPYRPNEELEMATWADYIYTNERNFVKRLRQFQPRTWYLPQAYDPDIHKPNGRPPNERKQVYICGSGFRGRIQLLEKIDWHKSSGELRIKGIWPDLNESPLMEFYEEGLVPNTQVVEDYHNAAICLNIHRAEGEEVVYERDEPNYYARERRAFAVTDAYSMNNRACEVAASGGFQVCDNTRAEVADVFGDSVPTFDDADGLNELIEYYVPRPEARWQLAQRACERIEGRTYLANAKHILTTMEA